MSNTRTENPADVLNEAVIRRAIDSAVLVFARGPVVYGTADMSVTEMSAVAVAKKSFDRKLRRINENGIVPFSTGKVKYIVMSESVFDELVDGCDAIAIEALLTPECFIMKGDIEKYRRSFVVNRKLLKESVIRCAEAEWNLCAEKLGGAGRDPFGAKQSMFRSLMILHVGASVLKRGIENSSLNDGVTRSIFSMVSCCENSWDAIRKRCANLYNEKLETLMNEAY